MSVSVNGQPPKCSVDMGAFPVIKVFLGAGPQGKTPVRGRDYWTEEDQAAVIDAAVEAVLARLAEQNQEDQNGEG